jgi:histone H3/H4
MAAKKKAAGKATRGKAGDSMIISKSRVKAAVKKCNVGGEFYGALEKKVRELIADAERRATENKRKTLRPADV